ncbi:MAG: MBL fold metallo-hydrolase [Desulfobacterales bacterium]|nr:MBL fold metallo-hydrolase [Desulfobacterales bacterium]
MRIKCWGSRGSISVSGKEYVKYGGDTTCLEIQANSGETIIVDAGTGIRRLGKSLVKRDVKECYMLLTHTHWDHIIGLPFFHPLLCADTTLKVQDRTFGGISTKEVIDEVMKTPFFPVRIEDYHADILFDASLNDSFTIGSVSIESIATSHSKDSLGFKFTENGKTFVFLTDNELGYAHRKGLTKEKYINFSKGADILFHDAEYTAEEYKCKVGWGHSSVDDVLDLAVKAGVGQLGLIHLNQDRTDDQMDDIVDQCNLFLNNQNNSIQCYGVSYTFETTL